MELLVILCLTFWETAKLFPTAAVSFSTTTRIAWEFQPLYTLAKTCDVPLKKKISSSPGRCEVVSHCGFGLHFPDDYCCWAPFYDFPFVCVLWRNIYSCPLPVFNWVVCLSAVELWLISLHTLDIKLWSDMGFASIFSHSVGCLFTLLVVSFDAQQLLKFWWMPIYLFLPFVTCGFSVIFNLHSSWVMLLLG